MSDFNRKKIFFRFDFFQVLPAVTENMSRKLHLLRHAHSVERQQVHEDKDRFVSPAGIEEAKRIGKYLQRENVAFDAVIASSAVRAHGTALLIIKELNTLHQPVLIDTLYDSTTRAYFEVVTNLDDQWNNVLLVGHNPLITYLAEYLTRNAIGDMATCGLVTINFEIDTWKEVSEGAGSLQSYIYPAMLH